MSNVVIKFSCDKQNKQKILKNVLFIIMCKKKGRKISSSKKIWVPIVPPASACE